MARKSMVTRTIPNTLVNVMCLDIIHAEPFNKEVVVPRTYADENKLFKAVQAIVDTEEVKAVHIVKTEVQETLYGMDEVTFIANAVILPPRKGNEETEEA